MYKISNTVGNDAFNNKADVLTVQRLLNKNIKALTPHLRLVEDGDCGPLTIGLIVEFQKRILKLSKPDGRVDPGKKTIQKLNELINENKQAGSLAKKPTVPTKTSTFNNLLLLVQMYYKSYARLAEKHASETNTADSSSKALTESDFKKAATLLGVDVASIKAVAKVESAGGGFLSNGKPKILFEGHWFSKLTDGKHDKKNPTISYPKWTKKHYLGGAKEYSRFNAAAAIDKEAAEKSTSWGKFQIMGFNHKKAGYASVSAFVKDMHLSEGKQLLAFVKFLQSTNLDTHLKSKDWASFAKGYNGPKYKENQYDIRLKQAYQAYSTGK